MAHEVIAEYDRWNTVIAEVMYPEVNVPVPVYLDMEDEQLADIAARMGIGIPQVQNALSTVVFATLDMTSQSSIFALHTRRLWMWSRLGQSTTPPPVLAVLAVLSLTAESMARGDGFSDGNFYGRLRNVLGIPQDDDRINHAYRRVAERYWGSLNVWLERSGGSRGIPTAFSMTHRYVGLAISQALVRRTDRERLVSFFQRFGLAPGTELPPTEMESILDHWMALIPCPATKNLERLWRSSSARSRIAQAAVVALAAWDGRVAEGKSTSGQSGAGRISLSLALSRFPAKRFELGVLVYASQPERVREALLVTKLGDVGVMLVPAIQGALGFGQSVRVGIEGLLEGVLRLRDELSSSELVHHPKRMLVFRQDPLSMRWIEAEHVLLGDDLMLLAHKDLEPRLMSVLSVIARPGWSLVAEVYPGLPTDWRVFRDVEIFSHPGDLVPPRMDDLCALVPLTSSQLKIAGGFALPGATRGKWHSWVPPEIRAVSDVPGGFKVRLIDLQSKAIDAAGYAAEAAETPLVEWEDDGEGALVVDLSEHDLEDGDYRVELVASGVKEAMSVTHLHLRSAETPDLMQWRVAEPVSYDLGDDLAALGAGHSRAGGVVVRGATVTGVNVELRRGELESEPSWRDTRPVGRPTSSPAVDIGGADLASCIYTGHHREQLDYVPTDRLGRALTAWSVGRCSGCGLVRRYSTSYHKNAREKTRKQEAVQARHRDVSLLHPVRTGDDRGWDTVLDGILHTGGGKWSLLERLAMHVEPTSLFVDVLARKLEALGHLDVRRDPQTLRPVAWEVAPAALSTTSAGMFLSGQWTQATTDTVSAAVQTHGGRFAQIEQPDGPISWYFTDVDVDDVERVARVVDHVTVQKESWRDIASSLPTLGSVLQALPRRPSDLVGRTTWFDVDGAKWDDVTDLRRPGGYRVFKYSTIDLIRTAADVDSGQIAVSTVHLSKHAASLIVRGRPLVAYDHSSLELSVPLGADLPGLYGRAVVLASGMLPEPRGRQLIYLDVPPELAAHLAHLLSH